MRVVLNRMGAIEIEADKKGIWEVNPQHVVYFASRERMVSQWTPRCWT